MFRARFANWKSSITRRDVSAFTRNDHDDIVASDDGIIELERGRDEGGGATEKENVGDPFLPAAFARMTAIEISEAVRPR